MYVMFPCNWGLRFTQLLYTIFKIIFRSRNYYWTDVGERLCCSSYCLNMQKETLVSRWVYILLISNVWCAMFRFFRCCTEKTVLNYYINMSVPLRTFHFLWIPRTVDWRCGSTRTENCWLPTTSKPSIEESSFRGWSVCPSCLIPR